VSDLSGKQADDDQMAKLMIYEHPQYQGPIILDVLPDERLISKIQPLIGFGATYKR
jgi:hypothetical protein